MTQFNVYDLTHRDLAALIPTTSFRGGECMEVVVMTNMLLYNLHLSLRLF